LIGFPPALLIALSALNLAHLALAATPILAAPAADSLRLFPALILAHRALWAAAIRARPAADMRRLWERLAFAALGLAGAPVDPSTVSSRASTALSRL
jgi:hypothetical protein